MEIMERVNHIMKEKEDERIITTEDIVSGLYVEMLASDINRVKLNGYRWVRGYKSGTR